MDNRERFLRTMRYEPVDRRPLHLVGAWPDTLARWRREGLPADVRDVHAYLGVESLRVLNLSGVSGVYPAVPARVVREDDAEIIHIDGYGRTVRDFKNHTSMPEWLDFPVKSADDLRRYLDEHFDVGRLDERFDAAWAARLRTARETPDAVTLIDGGCYYWTLRSIAGVEHASYLLLDALELVDELFERYWTVTMEGLKRVSAQLRIDVIGFGEDIAFRNGPFMSPPLFRRHRAHVV
jgi:hypothetical protein